MIIYNHAFMLFKTQPNSNIRSNLMLSKLLLKYDANSSLKVKQLSFMKISKELFTPPSPNLSRIRMDSCKREYL